MGPIALFDKSFLQSLTVDELVWFDHFFYLAPNSPLRAVVTVMAQSISVQAPQPA